MPSRYSARVCTGDAAMPALRRGGCSLQHMDDRAQVAAKQILKITSSILASVGASSSYCHIWSSLGLPASRPFIVRHVAQENAVLVAFREKRSSLSPSNRAE